MPLDDETYETILGRVANGELVTTVAKEYGVSRALVWKKSEVTDQGVTFTRARASQAHSMAEDTVILADSAKGLTADGVAAVRLAVDTRKWLITKIAPRLYGDRLDVQAEVRHTVSGVIALPDEDVPALPAMTVTARLTSPSADVPTSPSTRGDVTQAVTDSEVTRDSAPVGGEGVGGGDGAGTGGVDATP